MHLRMPQEGFEAKEETSVQQDQSKEAKETGQEEKNCEEKQEIAKVDTSQFFMRNDGHRPHL
jgi:hypothetical protein